MTTKFIAREKHKISIRLERLFEFLEFQEVHFRIANNKVYVSMSGDEWEIVDCDSEHNVVEMIPPVYKYKLVQER